MVFILDGIQRFYEIAVITNRYQYAYVRCNMYLDSGTGCHIQANAGLFALSTDGKIHACPEIYER